MKLLCLETEKPLTKEQIQIWEIHKKAQLERERRMWAWQAKKAGPQGPASYYNNPKNGHNYNTGD